MTGSTGDPLTRHGADEPPKDAARDAPLDFSVLICTYNNAATLMRCLESVAIQRLPDGPRWEVVIVDNNSSDETAAVAARFANDRRLSNVRLVRERRQGIGHARRRAFIEARGALFICADDDVLLPPDWIATARRIVAERPRAGIVGGRVLLEWQEEPSAIAMLYGESLARQDWGDRAFRIEPPGRRCLVGAALVIQREAMRQSGWIEFGELIGRRGSRLDAGEDAEIFFRIRHAGWEGWYDPALVVGHIIPARRSSLDHLRKLNRGFGRAEAFLEALSRTPRPTLIDRLAAMGRAMADTGRVLARWPIGYVWYVNERPTWLIRLSHTAGRLAGAARFLITGRGG